MDHYPDSRLARITARAEADEAEDQQVEADIERKREQRAPALRSAIRATVTLPLIHGGGGSGTWKVDWDAEPLFTNVKVEAQELARLNWNAKAALHTILDKGRAALLAERSKT